MGLSTESGLTPQDCGKTMDGLVPDGADVSTINNVIKVCQNISCPTTEWRNNILVLGLSKTFAAGGRERALIIE